MADNVRVNVEWTQQEGADYNVRVFPLASLNLKVAKSTNLVTLDLSYNTEYNFSVVAVTPCGNATAFMRLNYSKV